MSVQADDALKEYPGNGAGVTFDGPRLFDPDTLTVSLVNDLTGAVTSPSYTLTNVGINGPSKIVMDVAPPTGTTLQLRRTLPYGQSADFTNQQTLLRRVVEAAFDVVVMLIQQLADGVKRSLRFGDNAVGFNGEIQNYTPLGVLQITADGKGIDAGSPNGAGDMLLRPNLASDTGGTLVRVKQSGTGAVGRTLEARIRDTIHAADFGVVGDNVTDNSTGLANAIAEAALRNGASILLPPGIIRHTQPILITSNGVELVGAGTQISHNGGTSASPGTALFYVGGAAVDQVTFTSPAGASSQKRVGGGLRNLWLDGNAVATRGLLVRSWTRGIFENVYVQNVATAGFQIDVIAGSLAEGKDTRDNSFANCYAYVSGSTAHGWVLDGDAVANACFNMFRSCGSRHRNGDAWRLGNSDNNVFTSCGGFREPAGTGYALDMFGDTVSNGPCRSNHFIHFSGNGGVIARQGTVVSAIRNTITFYDTDNASPDPVVQTGAQLFWATDDGTQVFGTAVKQAIADTPTSARAARALITSETVRIRNAGNKHVILDDGTNEWTLAINAAGHLSVSGPAGKFILPFKHTYHAASASLAWDPGARTATATIGASGAPPAQVAGYLTMFKEDGTTVIKVPFYNP